MNIVAYLKRIGIGTEEAVPRPIPSDLARLQRQHLLHVPFENLDIHWKRPIVLDTARFYQKIVEDGRGGFCYELNGLFNLLLKGLAFKTRLVSARVATGGGGRSEEYAHAAIIAKIDGAEYLADVGFGAFTAEPLKIALDEEQQDRTGAYIIREGEDGYLVVLKKEGGDWNAEYMFRPQGRDLDEFAEMCEFHQTSKESPFTLGKVCSLMTGSGRKTLRDDKFIVTVDDKKTEVPVSSEEEFDHILMREFGIRR